ncbi:MAG: hypothetical protein JWM47_1649 [Acidimicrobiales bacterium]|nr:hypothetical protein [Acidimicrobiales bacterium]
MKRGDQRYHHLTDGRDSIDALTDPKGQRVQLYRYDPWGRATLAIGGVDQPFRWNSEYAINDYDYKIGARWYDASIGRWTQRDPAGQDPNHYTYANNDPINNTDPSGLGFLGIDCPFGKNDDGGCRGADQARKASDVVKRCGAGGLKAVAGLGAGATAQNVAFFRGLAATPARVSPYFYLGVGLAGCAIGVADG